MRSPSFRLTEAERRHLAAGAAVLGIELDGSMLNNFGRFAEILDLWSPRMNLISCGSARELVERHFLDSLAIAPLLPDSGVLVDLGTGAGFPGIPLALQRSDQPFVLVEARRKRVTFLREVRRTIGLENVEILEGRAETPPESHRCSATAVMTRAVWSSGDLAVIAPRWLRPDGMVFSMRSEPAVEGSHLPLQRRPDVHYRIGNDRRRTVEVFALSGSDDDCST